MKMDHAISSGHTRFAEKLLTINSNTGSPEYASLFILTGLVLVYHIDGHVENAALAAALTAVYLDSFPTGGAAVALTKIAGAPAISDFEVGSYLGKDREAGQILTAARANVAIFEEQDNALQEIRKPFVLGKKSGAVTTVRMVYTAGGDYTSETGKVHWQAEWVPISDDGFVEPA